MSSDENIEKSGEVQQPGDGVRIIDFGGYRPLLQGLGVAIEADAPELDAGNEAGKVLGELAPGQMVEIGETGAPEGLNPGTYTTLKDGVEGSNGSLSVRNRDGSYTMVRLSKWD